jgi:hypothetical protein
MQLPTLRPLRALALFLFLGGFGYRGGGSFLVEGRGPFYNLPEDGQEQYKNAVRKASENGHYAIRRLLESYHG